MQWDLYRSFEAVARLGSLTAAARVLDISQSTVSRHLARLEDHAGSPLVVRGPGATLTARGEALRAAVRPMLDAALSADAALRAPDAIEGVVTISTVGELIRWWLVPRIAGFYARHPRLGLRLLADNRVASLAAGDADIALRMARPVRGDLIVRRLYAEPYGVFVAADAEVTADTPWLGLAGSLAGIPEQAYAERLFAHRPLRLRVEDVESLGLATRAGLGLAVLPRSLVPRVGGLVEVEPAALGGLADPPAPRSVWMVVHRARHGLPAVRAVMDWLVEVAPE